MLTNLIRYLSLQSHWKTVEKAKVAQLVERNLAKVKVAGSRPVFRSKRARKGFFYSRPPLKRMTKFGLGAGSDSDRDGSQSRSSKGF